MITKSANDAAIRIVQLKEAIAVMAEADSDLVKSLHEDIDLLAKQIETDLKQLNKPREESIAQPIAPNI
jgi:archaellum component FlaG (FlaF/FlaG flagellin family)